MGENGDRQGGERADRGPSHGVRQAERSRAAGSRGAHPSDEEGTSATSNGMVRYRWTCPVCGETGSGLTRPEQGRTHSVNNLKSHIRTTGDDAHGPTNAYPEAFEAGLDEHVEVPVE